MSPLLFIGLIYLFICVVLAVVLVVSLVNAVEDPDIKKEFKNKSK